MWKLDNVRIFVQKMVGDMGQIIPRLQPLSDSTVLQFFGWEDEIIKVGAKVVGESDLETIRAMRTDAATHNLTGYDSFNESWYVKSISWSRDNYPFQTIRPDLDCETPVFTIEIEFYVQ